MPGTHDEVMQVVYALADQRIMPDDPLSIVWEDGSFPSAHELHEVASLALYEIGWRVRNGKEKQRKARRLLHQFLTKEQKRQIKNGWEFKVIGKSGNVYSIRPDTGVTHLVEKHGKRYYSKCSYCLHDDFGKDSMPNADICLAHLLFILSDEEGFLKEANAHPIYNQAWDPSYMAGRREIRRAQLERARA